MKQVLAVALLVAATPRAGAASYTLDPTHTFASFEVPHFATSVIRGRFDRKAGRIEFDRAAKTGRVEMTIDLASVSTGVASLDKHMQGKDFFDSAEFPTAQFVGDGFVFSGDKVAEVAGSLTLRGQSHPVTLKASNFNCYTSPLFKREVCGGDFEATIQRSQWGINGGLPAVAPDNVRLLIQVEAIRQP
jgi:polyisoprenoid-binding protein YceI